MGIEPTSPDTQSGALPLSYGPAPRHEPRRTCQFFPRLWAALAKLARPGSPRLHPGDRGRFGAIPESYRVRTCNAQICSLAANMTRFSYLFSLVTVTHTDVLKIRTVSVRVRLGHGRSPGQRTIARSVGPSNFGWSRREAAAARSPTSRASATAPKSSGVEMPVTVECECRGLVPEDRL